MADIRSAAGIIPARYDSVRFPGKPLVPIRGVPLVCRVLDRARLAETLTEVIVATDDERIFEAVERHGGRAVMTRRDHPTGTDRLAEVAAKLNTELIVNIQGDEPLMDPKLIDRAVRRFSSIPDFRFGSAMTPIRDKEDLDNPNVVKVAVNQAGAALYFSRYPLPYRRTESAGLPTFQHIGFYVYRRDFLLEYPGWLPTPLEKAESLEQLRALENGVRIDMIETPYKGVGVDAPEDVSKVERMIDEAKM